MKLLDTAGLIVAFGVACGTAQAGSPAISVAKSATCGCCNAWIEHLKAEGFDVEAHDMTQPGLQSFKLANGITAETMSCHTAKVDGYTIEGHVPAADIRKLLKQRPEAVGLSVPGMPLGSPGMEMGDTREAYDVLLIGADGETEVFSSYGAQ